jgi:MinD superfamily P-loop ATPase
MTMILTVASGKGGTGKTTVATSLALANADSTPLLLDCDVEAPNAHLFLAPQFESKEQVLLPVPVVDEDRCTACGRCAEVCLFHAMAVVAGKVLFFPELCHSCGSCMLQCPEGAIHETERSLGTIEEGVVDGGMNFAHGILNIGEPMAVPIIHALKGLDRKHKTDLVIRDSPPGASCPVVETMRGSDFILLVTEPTPFGLHDLRQAYKLTRVLGIPSGVVVNRDGVGDAGVDDYCREVDLPILMRIPLDRKIGEAIAQGRTLADAFPDYLPGFRQLLLDIQELIAREGHRPAVGVDRGTSPKAGER